MFGADLVTGTDNRLEVETLVCPNVLNPGRLLELTNSRVWSKYNFTLLR